MHIAIPVRIVWYPPAVPVGGVPPYLVALILTPFLVSAAAVYIFPPLVEGQFIAFVEHMQGYIARARATRANSVDSELYKS